ncbi:uncharacterized protein LTHEOB_3858 [Lasiodiplodia theobromae]|uniref:uncharacterized protein n=1 Tax=Lasiodiplodia theobromae TaxID=45133 RepID=UPI0015C34349|nr:uncharacterized protein LTHEOB_3858 [Lasiodiplodia theobromae]KAF4546550.1 hypothetical protein LTHEOB_3858 [Lasiodiplodia theobromae]
MRKMRCDGNFPCSTCVARNAGCGFGTSASTLPVEEPGNGDKVQQHIDAYFTHFHPIWPFLHKATFNPDQEPALLLQSVIMIGLWTMQDETAKDAAIKLHEKLIASIIQQQGSWVSPACGEQSGGNNEPWPVGTYQGILLNIIFALLLSSEEQRTRGSTCRLDLKAGKSISPSEDKYRIMVALIKSCLQRGMFFYPDMLAQFNGRSSNFIFIWVGVEEVKRLALTLFHVWSTCSEGSDAEGDKLLSTKDLKFSMPEQDILWVAPSDEDLLRRLERGMGNGTAMKNGEEHWIAHQFREGKGQQA